MKDESTDKLRDNSGLVITGGDGSSAEKALVINAKSSKTGISAEYAYIERLCGIRGVDYIHRIQRLMGINDRMYDVLEIEMKDGSVRSFWFDITAFYGKGR